MYRYDEFDHAFVHERVAQFRHQLQGRIDGTLTEEEFRPLRLMNGVYLQLHAYMLRVAIPYGTLSSVQMHKLAELSQRYDRGYGHFTTRQNIQYNWPKLRDIPDMLNELAEVEMHAIQTSGNCIRNITCDPFAGVADDEVEDPRPLAELIRQWSTLHPEFSYLPRKFKIAVTGSPQDRAAVYFHDIGLRIVRNAAGDTGCEVIVGGGQGRTPVVGKVLAQFVAKSKLLAYLESILRVYNLHGRRDNKYKARIKILVNSLGLDEFRREVELDFASPGGHHPDLDESELARIEQYFAGPAYLRLPAHNARLAAALATDPAFGHWYKQNVMTHKVPGYAAVTVTLKNPGGIPGDATAAQMVALAELAERYSFSELRITHAQNVVLPDVRGDDLHRLWQALGEHGLSEGNRGLITDIIACPGLDYCTLANARSIPIAQTIAKQFSDPQRQREIGPLTINISGCMNACGHHHVGHIGILGVEKGGQEFYQITLGGDSSLSAQLGERLGPGFSANEITPAIEKLVDYYCEHRSEAETFLQCVRRVGVAKFKDVLYANYT